MSRVITLLINTKRSNNYQYSIIAITSILTIFALYNAFTSFQWVIIGFILVFVSFAVMSYLDIKKHNEYNTSINRIISRIQENRKEGLFSLGAFISYNKNELSKEKSKTRKLIMAPNTFYGRYRKIQIIQNSIGSLEYAQEMLKDVIKGR